MDWQKIEYAKGGITRSIYDKNGTWARREDVEKLIDDRKDLVRKYKDQIGRTARAIIERDELRVEVERLGGLLDEVQDLCKVQENFPFRGHLEDILAKRKGGA